MFCANTFLSQHTKEVSYMKRQTLIDALTALSGILSFVGRETDKSKVEAPKQHENDILAGKLI